MGKPPAPTPTPLPDEKDDGHGVVFGERMMNKKRFDENKKEEGVIKVGAIVTSSRGKHKRIVYSQEEARLRTVKDVIEQMVEAVKTNQTLNLNNAKNKAAKKYGVDGTVRLTEIISAAVSYTHLTLPTKA